MYIKDTMKTVIFLFEKEAYKEGLDRSSKFNIFKWTYDMCNNEFALDNGLVFKLDLSNEEDLYAFEDDFNEDHINFARFIVRAFNIDNNE